ncbi:MAG: restriction endonuclease subunit S [Oscillospiraceae bacterium]|nr:restriction endonuclease subunit S [Oscillospiraceae bacterium]
MKLNQIASVRTGLVLSRKEAKNTDEFFEYRQLNLKSVTDQGTICLDETIRFCAVEELSSNYLTQAGDVIVKLSDPYTAVYITAEYAGLVVPSHFVIIRAEAEQVLPQYLAWYLSKDRIKKAYNMSCAGMLKQIKPTTIAETEIRLPSLERQRQVVELYEITRKELQLLEQLQRQKEAYYKALINQINRM